MTLYKRRKTWWVEYQVDGVRHRQSTHTHKYAVAKAWASQIDTARKNADVRGSRRSAENVLQETGRRSAAARSPQNTSGAS